MILVLPPLGAWSPAPLAASDPARTRLVVVLYPDDNDGRPGNLLVDRGIRSTFAAGSAGEVEVHSEYLDLSRNPDAEYERRLAEFLGWKYASRKVDLVIAGLSTALNFALKYRHDLFPGAPVVHCALGRKELEGRDLPPDVVGVPTAFDLAGTLDLALRLHPGTRRVYVVAGRAKFDAFWEAEARQTFRAYEDRLEFVYLTGLAMNDLLAEVARVPEGSIIYYLHVFQDGAGKAHIPAEVVGTLAAAASAPVYGHVDTYVGRGIVGGRVFGFEATGREAAGLGLRILGGERPQDLAVPDSSPSVPMFDWHQLRRWGIGEGDLPAGSDVRFVEPGFWDLYRWHVIGVVSLCIVEALLIAGLLVQRVGLVRAGRRFRQVVEAAPCGMIVADQEGRIVLANAQAEKLFDFPKEGLLGQPLETLLPERQRPEHRARRALFFAAPGQLPVGAGRELFGRRRDGSEFPMEFGLSPVWTDRGLLVLAALIDVTDRQKALDALRASRQELRVLAGRLLRAQETERRRIARELHDDLNQSLALLAIELDVLAQRPPESAAQVGRRASELAGRVRQLSSAVHDLSHQLHPSKLEQLGLLAALRSLCHELAQGHGLAIEFAAGAVPEAVPDDTALCLYRIAQEALQNVIKHSGAHRARVELAGGAEVLTLRVSDDGCGFDPGAATARGRLGLVGMQERLRLVGGELTLDARPAAGTRIEARVPLRGAGGAERSVNLPPEGVN